MLWCLKQPRGIRLEAQNKILAGAYLKKARSSLNMLNAAIEKEEKEWAATIDYYTRYYAVYALFQRCGIVSEIHDCTIAAFGYLFSESGIDTKELHDELLVSKENRIDAQYYISAETEIPEGDAGKAGTFVLVIEELMDKLDDDVIDRVRDKLKKLLADTP